MKKTSSIRRGMKIALIIIGVLVLVEVLALLVLRSQIDRYATYWADVANQPAAENALTYLALGDSAAQGIGATSPRRGYVGLIAKSLQQKHQQPVHVINISKSGARLEDCIADQLPRIKDLSPDIVTIEIGGNDMKDFNADKFRADFTTILDALPQKTVVSNMPYFGGGRFSKLEPNVVEANKIIAELTKERGIDVAELHDQVKTNDNINTYAVDLFHPSNFGYKNWHNAFWAVLEER